MADRQNPDTLRQLLLDPKDPGWIAQALLLSREAGWNQTADDWGIFLQHGTVLGLLEGDRLVATAATIPYGERFGWVSMVLVTTAWRRRGLASQLVAQCTAHLHTSGRAAMLDGAPAATGIYTGLGYLPLTHLERWHGPGGGRDIATTGLDSTFDFAIDTAAFGADRRFLLQNFLGRPGTISIRSSHGYTLLRRGDRATHIGPLVAEPDEALALLEAAMGAASGPVVIDILNGGRALLPYLHKCGFRLLRPFTRMASQLQALPGKPESMMAAAGPEFG